MVKSTGKTESAPLTPKAATARLRAVVAIDEIDRVQCQQPGCGHSIHAAVHVVEEDGRLLVLGSTCFTKRYGGAGVLGTAQYGGGSGRKLTAEERQMLVLNTASLLAHFEAQRDAEAAAAALALELGRAEELRQRELMADKLRSLRAVAEARQTSPTRVSGPPGLAAPLASPWPWQMPGTSVALFTAPGGAKWVRVQHRDGVQRLVPWPQFPGWEGALPEEAGVLDHSTGAIAVASIVEAIRVLHREGFQGPVVGRWQDVFSQRSGR